MHIPSMKQLVSAEEWQLRCDLAACYRLVALYGWSDLVFSAAASIGSSLLARPSAFAFAGAPGATLSSRFARQTVALLRRSAGKAPSAGPAP